MYEASSRITHFANHQTNTSFRECSFENVPNIKPEPRPSRFGTDASFSYFVYSVHVKRHIGHYDPCHRRGPSFLFTMIHPSIHCFEVFCHSEQIGNVLVLWLNTLQLCKTSVYTRVPFIPLGCSSCGAKLLLSRPQIPDTDPFARASTHEFKALTFVILPPISWGTS